MTARPKTRLGALVLTASVLAGCVDYDAPRPAPVPAPLPAEPGVIMHDECVAVGDISSAAC